jgi:hypothetical protein
MTDRAAMTENANPVEGGPREPHAEWTALEQRVRRLEDAVAGLQDTRQLEDRVAERLAARTRAGLPKDATGIIVEASRHLLPAPPPVDRPPDGQAAELPAPGAAAAQPSPRPARRPWLLFDLYADVRAAMYMFVDPRYRMSWSGRVLPWVLLGAILSSWFWIPFISLLYSVPALGPFLGTVIVKFVDLLLAFVLYKVLSREATRYRETSPDLPRSLRL